MSLSDKRQTDTHDNKDIYTFYYEEADVKEFIRLLKEEFKDYDMTIGKSHLFNVIDKLSGEKLNGKE